MTDAFLGDVPHPDYFLLVWPCAVFVDTPYNHASGLQELREAGGVAIRTQAGAGTR